jgi:CYTH domain-containing protein
MNNTIPVEIERKYVIRMPRIRELEGQDGYTVSEIRQTYLESEPGVTHRVRMRVYPDVTYYTETKKIRIDKISSYEEEREIDESTYKALLLKIKRGTRTLTKTRHTFSAFGRTFEVDIYPEWKRSCILEIELPSRETEIEMPPFISVIKEVSGDRKYTNASMSQDFPEELI